MVTETSLFTFCNGKLIFIVLLKEVILLYERPCKGNIVGNYRQLTKRLNE